MIAGNVTPISAGSGSAEGPQPPKPRKPKVPTETLAFRTESGDESPRLLLVALKYQFEAISEALSGADPSEMDKASYLAIGGEALAKELLRRNDEVE